MKSVLANVALKHYLMWRFCFVVLQVSGLKGLTYLDKSKDPKNPAQGTESRDLVTFGEGLVDSVYLEAPSSVELDVGTGEGGGGRGFEGNGERVGVIGKYMLWVAPSTVELDVGTAEGGGGGRGDSCNVKAP